MAAAQAAYGKGAPPLELKLAWQVTQWGALPEAGGLLDQPAGLLQKMSAAKSAYDVIKSRLTTNNVISWIDADPRRYDYYTQIKELLKHGN